MQVISGMGVLIDFIEILYVIPDECLEESVSP